MSFVQRIVLVYKSRSYPTMQFKIPYCKKGYSITMKVIVHCALSLAIPDSTVSLVLLNKSWGWYCHIHSSRHRLHSLCIFVLIYYSCGSVCNLHKHLLSHVYVYPWHVGLVSWNGTSMRVGLCVHSSCTKVPRVAYKHTSWCTRLIGLFLHPLLTLPLRLLLVKLTDWI